jgi:hypothetical protein
MNSKTAVRLQGELDPEQAGLRAGGSARVT